MRKRSWFFLQELYLWEYGLRQGRSLAVDGGVPQTRLCIFIVMFGLVIGLDLVLGGTMSKKIGDVTSTQPLCQQEPNDVVGASLILALAEIYSPKSGINV